MFQAPPLARQNISHRSAESWIQMNGVAVCNAGRVNLNGKDLMFVLWNDDPDRLRRRCAAVARPGASRSSKRSSALRPALPLNP